jgi:hypothetical protein
MTSTLIGFFVFWGIWLFVPLLIDGTTAVLYFIGAWRYERGPRRKREQFEVTVKVASDTDGTVFDVSAEYDDAVAVADQTGLSVRTIQQRAERMVRE